MARKEIFASIEHSRRRWRVRYTGPDGAPQAPHTFGARIDAEAGSAGAPQDRPGPVGRRPTTPSPSPHLRRLRGPLAGQPARRRQTHQGPHPRALPGHPGRSPAAHVRAPPAGRDQAEGRPRLVRGDSDRPAHHALHAYSLFRTIMASAVNDELIDANPARIVGAGRAKRVHRSGPPDRGTRRAHRGDARTAAADGHVGVWCALRFGETVELRRGDIDLSARSDPDTTRSGPHQRHATRSPHPRVDAGVRDVDIPPHIIPPIEAAPGEICWQGRDSLIFPADNGGHLQPSTLYRHWYQARERRVGPICASTTYAIPVRCWPRRPAQLGRTDGPARPFDPAGRDALSARRQGPGPRDRGAAVEAGRQRGGETMRREMLVFCEDWWHTADPVGPIITDPDPSLRARRRLRRRGPVPISVPHGNPPRQSGR